MSRLTTTTTAVGAVVASLALATLSAGAGVLQPPLELDPTSGPPGTEITVSGEDCQTKGDTWVTLELLDTEGATQDTAEVDVDSEDFAGAWQAVLTVPAATTDYGEWTVEAVCETRMDIVVESARAGRSVVLPAQSTDELFRYQPAPFTVTAPAQEPTTSTPTTPTTEAPSTAPVVVQPSYTG